MSYIHFSEEEKLRANHSDIVAYLRAHGENVKRSGKEYSWESPSGKVSIRENQWYSQYEQIGGGAVNFVQKYFGLSYPEAVKSLLGDYAGNEVIAEVKKGIEKEKAPFILPKKNDNENRLYAYLLGERFLSKDIVRAFVEMGLLYEDAVCHNAVFVGTDKNGNPRHAQKRATSPSSEYKGNVAGSEAEYSFHYVGTSKKLFVFEAPIDMLAFLTLYPKNWKQHSYVALCSTADRAAVQILKSNPNLSEVYLCLDYDGAGLEGCYRLASSIHTLGAYSVFRIAPKNKDWDEDLKELHGRTPLPSKDYPKAAYMEKRFDELRSLDIYSTRESKVYARAQGLFVDETLAKLHLLFENLEVSDNLERQERLTEIVNTILAFCFFRSKQMQNERPLTMFIEMMRNQYLPHEDTENQDFLFPCVQKSFRSLEREIHDGSAVTVDKGNRQIQAILRIALDCLRLSYRLTEEMARKEDVKEGTILEGN